uniref:Uncharacterized protein n=1 Tax=Kalanchoe fedtschenkoi TaxID=63787 RepID=A0A7N0TVI3_KALFE
MANRIGADSSTESQTWSIVFFFDSGSHGQCSPQPDRSIDPGFFHTFLGFKNWR